MKVHIALPVLNEYENLPGLIRYLEEQSYKNFDCVCCVNQPESWWENPEKKLICEDNQRSIQYLKSISDIDLTVIDRSSTGSGWKGKKRGVGWARKEAMELCNRQAYPDDIIVSMDADTEYPENYLASIVESFSENEKSLGLSVPYYHKLTNSVNDRLILRYEIYMRYYLLNMFRIANPYAFTALGSAMAATVRGYRKVSGITPVKSGEDFYFLQKLAKSGNILVWTDTLAYPSSRFSDRVFFGTGPAMIKGSRGDWRSNPVYSSELFDRVYDTYQQFPDLFDKDHNTPMDDFLMKQFSEPDIWGALRKNYIDRDNFVKACIKKVDGLRILQFLKTSHGSYEPGGKRSYCSLYNDLNKVVDLSSLKVNINNPLEELAIDELHDIRELLFERERIMRKKIMITGI